MEENTATTNGQTNSQNETKLSYDDLMNIARQQKQQLNQLGEEYSKLLEQLQQVNGIEKRLYFLFEVVKCDKFREDFIKVCMDEIENILTIPEQKDQKEESKEEYE